MLIKGPIKIERTSYKNQNKFIGILIRDTHITDVESIFTFKKKIRCRLKYQQRWLWDKKNAPSTIII